MKASLTAFGVGRSKWRFRDVEANADGFLGRRVSPRMLFLVVAGPLFVVYALTATYSRPYNIDAFTNVLTAWELGREGSVYLHEHEHLADPLYIGNVGWVVRGADGVVSQYPPGAALHAVPLYAVWPEDPTVSTVTGGNRPAPPVDVLVPPLAPAAITAALVVALAMGMLAVTFHRLVPATAAIVGAYLLGLGTSAWSVAADQLWQHGPGMLWIAVGGFLLESRPWASGGAYAIAVLIRPPTALVAAAAGLIRTWRERSWRPALKIGIASATGLAAIIAYSAAIFGRASVSGGYGGVFVVGPSKPTSWPMLGTSGERCSTRRAACSSGRRS